MIARGRIVVLVGLVFACRDEGQQPMPVPPVTMGARPEVVAETPVVDDPAVGVDAAVDAPTGVDPAARALIEKALVAQGSPERIRRISTIIRHGTLYTKPLQPLAEVDRVRFPDRTRVDTELFDQIVGLDGTTAWRKVEDRPAVEDRDLVDELEQSVWSDPVRVLAHLLDDNAVLVAAPPVERVVDGKPLYEIQYERRGMAVTLRLDTKTLRLTQRQYRHGRGDESFDYLVTYADFRRVDGVWIAHLFKSAEIHPDRTTRSERRWKRIELDKPLADSLFAMPK